MNEKGLVCNWLEQAVLGLGLCPFAGEHWSAGRVRLTVTAATSERVLLQDLQVELSLLETTDSSLIETTVLIVPKLLREFSDYNQFLGLADALIEEQGWAGCFQIASFHPGYQFEGTKYNDPENLTNRSPFPLLHLLREITISRALAQHPNPDQRPLTNIATLRALSEKSRQEIFGFLPEY